jgi:hypothetical protein
MTKKNDGRIRALLVDLKEAYYAGENMLNIRAHVVTCDEHGQTVRNPDPYAFHDGETPRHAIKECDLNNFVIEVHSPKDTPDNFHSWIYWSAKYMAASDIDLRRAEGMVRTLKIVKKSMQKIYDEMGPVETFGQYLARNAKALGAVAILVETGVSGQSWGYDAYTFRMMTPGDAASYIDHQISLYVSPIKQNSTV